MKYRTDDLRIRETKELVSPAQVHEQYPITEKAAEVVYTTRQAIHEILHGRDDRLLVVVGPCSIHDVVAARDYATRLAAVRDRLGDDLLIVMRVYFEKPRTIVGWKGLINDPDLDQSFHINKGLRLARELLLYLNEMDVPAGTEYLDLISPQYVADLVSWGAIGARTTESQGHRELSSGLSCPVGFKNGTDGTLKIAVDAVAAAMRPHHFLSVTKEGRTAIFSTSGNDDCHVILRGGTEPNYDSPHVQQAARDMEAAGLTSNIMVDFSHANSRKRPPRQREVADDVAAQIAGGERRIIGAMIESHLLEGRQDVVPGQPLTYGQSITDACIGWDDTIPILDQLAEAVRRRKETRPAAAYS
jgi:3-deoxy-7-phosphoheptulonate synthase